LKDLVQLNNKLFQECKGLENDLQTLIYDNYNTFIEASDTISKINVQFGDLD
jgi:hypothetical protein